MDSTQGWKQHPPIILQGELDIVSREALIESLQSAESWQRVTVDLSGVSFLDAGALGCFVGLHNSMRRVHPRSGIRFIGASPHIARLFSLTHLDSLFELYDGSEPYESGAARSAMEKERLYSEQLRQPQSSLSA